MRQAAWCADAGAVLALAAGVCAGLDLVSAQQTIAMALPCSLLAAGGLMASAAVPNEEIAQRGFQAGYMLGALLGFGRSASGRQDGF